MDEDDPVRVLGPEGGHVGRPEALVHRAVALPQQEAGLLHVGLLQATAVQAGVPHPHVALGVAELEAGVAAQVLVGEEQDLVAPGLGLVAGSEGPGQHGPGVGRGADGPAVAPHEGLQGAEEFM